jgi:hypothetical protein
MLLHHQLQGKTPFAGAGVRAPATFKNRDTGVPLREVRDTARHPPTRTSRSKAKKQGQEARHCRFVPVPLIDFKFLNELAAGDAGTSNRSTGGCP